MIQSTSPFAPHPISSPQHESMTSYSWPLSFLLLVLLGLLVSTSALELALDEPPYWWFNLLGPGVFALSALWTASRLMRWRGSSLWTPLPWFLISVAVFYGLGPLYYLFADADGLEVLDAIWSIDEKDLWRTNFMVLLGTFSIIGTYLFAGFWINAPSFSTASSRNTEQQQNYDVLVAKRLLTVFLVMSVPLRYLLAVPYSLGIIKFVLPGFLFNLSLVIYVCLILLAFLSLREGGRWRIAFWGLFFLELAIGFLSFNKTALLYPPLHAAMGFFLARNQLKSLLLWFVVVILLYLVSRPFIAQSRILLQQAGLRQGASFEQRFQVAQSASKEDGVSLNETTDLGWWSRLNYATFQAYVVNLYDSGEAGTTLETIPFIFIPRFFWPNKPDMTAAGFDFTERIFGHRSSSTGIGVFGEAYWNGGYTMMLVICSYIGLVFLLLSWLAVSFIERKQWIYFPLILSGIRIGLGIDQWIVPIYFGSLVLYAAYFVLLYVIARMTMNDLRAPSPSLFRWRGLGVSTR